MTQYRYYGRLALSLSLAITGFASARPAYAQTCTSTQYGTVTEGSYTIQNDKWGEADDPGGYNEVCTGNSSNNSWSATWNWTKGSGKIKAYPSMYRGWEYGAFSPDRGGFPVQVSAQKPLPTSVTFNMTGSNQYDNAYDLFFSPQTDPSGPSAELMVWLNYSGNQPAGTKVASGVALGGVSGTWDVWQGTNGWPVWSFVRTSQVSSFSGNLQPFVYYVSSTKGWLNSSWYELNVQFGTEIIQSNGSNGSLQVTQFSASAY